MPPSPRIIPASGQRRIERLRRGLSLEKQLPLLMTGLLAIVLAASLLLTYGTLTRSAEQAARDRLRPAVRELASTIDESLGDLARLMRQVADEKALSEAISASGTAGALDTSSTMRAARTVLGRLRTGSDSNAPVELWSVDARRLTFTGASEPLETSRGPSDVKERHPVRRTGLENEVPSDSMVFGRLHSVNGRNAFWLVASVIDGGRKIGYVAWRRPVSSPPRAAASLRDLTGENVSMYLRNEDAGYWAGASGAQAPVPIARSRTNGDHVHVRDGVGRSIAAEQAVTRAQWVVVLEEPLRSIYARPRSAVLSLFYLSLMLMAAGAMIAWGISRRITAPLATLSRAAEAISAGDYRRRVDERGDDEVARVASSFNRMAGEVEASRREQELRVEEAQSVAEELELANEQLQEAMIEAEEAQREAESAREEAERANRAKSDFLAVMSHELRTPLNAIGGYTQLLELEIHGPVTEAQRDALTRIARSQLHLLALINDVLNFARIDAGKVHYAIGDVPIDEALAGVEALIGPQIRAKRLDFIRRRCAEHIAARADRDKLLQIVLNLLTNAIKFTPEGGSVRVECQAGRDVVRISVSDTGLGIPLERQQAIFDPFVQVDRALHRPNDGVGLGLAISRDLARGMGGELSVQSTVGHGSTFTVTLTRCDRHSPDDHTYDSSPGPVAGAATHGAVLSTEGSRAGDPYPSDRRRSPDGAVVPGGDFA